MLGENILSGYPTCLLFAHMGWWHCVRQGQHGREDQGGRLHYDVSLWLEFSSTTGCLKKIAFVKTGHGKYFC